jgi:RIO-like serine/threonine protein kinase
MTETHMSLHYILDGSDIRTYSTAIEKLLAGKSCWKTVKRNSRNIIAFHPELKVYFKSFNHAGPKERLKRIFAGSRAQRTFNGTRLLHLAGCQAPDIVAMGRFADHDFILMESVQGPPLLNTLESYLKHQSHPNWRLSLYQELGLTIGKMHSHGVIHGDLRGNNVVILPENHYYRLALIDNERTRQAIRFRREQRRNLKQIMLFGPQYITEEEQKQFFVYYFQAFPHPPRRAKQIEVDILREVNGHFKRKGIVQGTAITETDYWTQLAKCRPYELSRFSNNDAQPPLL